MPLAASCSGSRDRSGARSSRASGLFLRLRPAGEVGIALEGTHGRLGVARQLLHAPAEGLEGAVALLEELDALLVALDGGLEPEPALLQFADDLLQAGELV